ncbi:MAG TPA: ester cyclase [Nocardioidaceae bacterium]|nr:ester cyclase [Nocardioidaceae bacterium]
MTANANEAVIRRWVDDMWNANDRGVCDELIAERFTEHAHAPFADSEPGEGDGPDMVRTSMDWLLAQFPDLRMTVVDLVSAGDTVAARVRSDGTNLGRLNGFLPPSGKRFSAEQTHWFRLADGKIAEHWATRDDLTTMLQL